MISTDISQLLWIIEAGGIVIQKKDVNGVVVALDRLYTDVFLSDVFGLNGRKKIEERYSLSAMNVDTERVYEELVL